MCTLVAVSGSVFLSSCGDSSSAGDKARDAASQVDSAVDAGLARGRAEIFRQRAKDLVRQGENVSGCGADRVGQDAAFLHTAKSFHCDGIQAVPSHSTARSLTTA
jgi:hypothetical protein